MEVLWEPAKCDPRLDLMVSSPGRLPGGSDVEAELCLADDQCSARPTRELEEGWTHNLGRRDSVHQGTEVTSKDWVSMRPS